MVRNHSSSRFLRVLMIIALALSLAPSAPVASVAASSSGTPGKFVATGYQRIFTTGVTSQPALQSGETRDFRLAGTLGIPVNVEAVLVDVTVTSATANSTVQIWETGSPRPGNSIVRFTPATTPQTNTAIVEPNASGLASIYNAAGSTHINVDVQGYFTAGTGSAFTAVRQEVVNTAAGLGASGPVGNGGSISTQVTGTSVPNTATAVFANVSVVYPAHDGSLTFHGRGAAPGAATSLNFSAGLTDSAGMVIPLDAAGGFATRMAVTSGNVHVYIDIQGYFAGNGTSAEGAFVATPSTQVLGASPAGSGSLQPGEVRSFPVTAAGVPEYGSEGVVLNVTVFNVVQTGHIKVYGKGFVAPTNPLLAVSANESFGFASTTVVPVGLDGAVTIENTSAGAISVSVRVQGWFAGHRAVSAGEESDFVSNAARLGVPTNVARLAVWHQEMADQMPQSVEVTTTPPASNIDDSVTMIEDGPDVETLPPVITDPAHSSSIAPVTEEESESLETPVALRGAEEGSCRRKYRLQSLEEYVMIESVTNVNLYWLQLDKRWCASRTLHKIGSYYTTQTADVTAIADTFIDDKGTLTDGSSKDEWLKYDGVHTKSGHFSQRVRRFRFCMVKGIPICYDTELAQAATVAYDWSAFSDTFKWNP